MVKKKEKEEMKRGKVSEEDMDERTNPNKVEKTKKPKKEDTKRGKAGQTEEEMDDRTNVNKVEKLKKPVETVVAKKKGMGATLRKYIATTVSRAEKKERKERKLVGKQKSAEAPADLATDAVPERKTKTQVEGEKRNAAELAQAEWFFGAMPREYVEEYLKNIGDFAVRMTMAPMPDMKHDEIEVSYIISVKYEKGMKHVKVNEMTSGTYGFTTNQAKPFPTIVDLINSYKDSKHSLLSTYRLVIVKPAQRPDYLLRDCQLTRGGELGKGAFGIVYSATLKLDSGEELQVVQKRTKMKTTDDQRKELIREAHLLRECRHENVVECMGLQVDTFPISIVMEICDKGSLDSYLRKGKAKMEEKMQWTKQAAAGLASLERNSILHRDIAARNCLLKGPRLDLKLADLGLAKRADKNGEYLDKDRKNIPFRWYAPEAIKHGRCSYKSDVFSYAVLLWEIYNDGANPWGGKASKDIVEAVVYKGKRLEWPPTSNVPSEVKKLASACWLSSVDDRPSFHKILEKLGAGSATETPLKRAPSANFSEAGRSPVPKLLSRHQSLEKTKSPMAGSGIRVGRPAAQSLFVPLGKSTSPSGADGESSDLGKVRGGIPKLPLHTGTEASPAHSATSSLRSALPGPGTTPTDPMPLADTPDSKMDELNGDPDAPPAPNPDPAPDDDPKAKDREKPQPPSP